MTTNYETDVVAWANEQAALLRSGQFAGLDLEHLAEEIESMGSSQNRELKNRLAVLLQHLLKWNFQPDHRTRSWRSTLLAQRTAIDDLLSESPSLRCRLAESFAVAYPRAVRLAATETGIDARLFPTDCPYSQDEVLAEDWFPSGESEQDATK